MSDDIAPVLDRYTQEDLGRRMRARLESTCPIGLSDDLESLLVALRECDRGGKDRRDDD